MSAGWHTATHTETKFSRSLAVSLGHVTKFGSMGYEKLRVLSAVHLLVVSSLALGFIFLPPAFMEVVMTGEPWTQMWRQSHPDSSELFARDYYYRREQQSSTFLKLPHLGSLFVRAIQCVLYPGQTQHEPSM